MRSARVSSQNKSIRSSYAAIRLPVKCMYDANGGPTRGEPRLPTCVLTMQYTSQVVNHPMPIHRRLTLWSSDLLHSYSKFDLSGLCQLHPSAPFSLNNALHSSSTFFHLAAPFLTLE